MHGHFNASFEQIRQNGPKKAQAQQADAVIAAVRAMRGERNSLAAQLRATQTELTTARHHLGNAERMTRLQQAILTLESIVGGMNAMAQGARPHVAFETIYSNLNSTAVLSVVAQSPPSRKVLIDTETRACSR
jgi:hypothetical protein